MSKKNQIILIIFSLLILAGGAGCKNAVELHEHTFEEDWTCDSNYHWHNSVCEHKEEIVSGRAEHTWGDWKIVTASTESESGLRKRACTVCGYEENEITAKLEHIHTFESEWTSNAVSHWHKATCQDEEEIIKDKADHNYGDWEIKKAATATQEGLQQRECQTCGYIQKEIIPVLGHKHTFSSEWSKDSLYHWHKASCQHEEEILKDRAEHSYGNWVVIYEPTETERGEKRRVCSVCHYEEKQYPELCSIHKFIDGVVTKQPTCSEVGQTTYTCECGKLLTVSDVPKTPHKITGGVKHDATILEGGYEEGDCAVCGEHVKNLLSPRLFCETPLTSSLTTPDSSTESVYFGDFPGTIVQQNITGKILYGKDNQTVITISETPENSVTRGSNTYYIGSDGEYYCKVTLAADNIRWYRVEPIEWSVLTTDYSLDYQNENAEKACLLVATKVLNGNVPYYYSKEGTRSVGNDKNIYPSNYKYSQIRAYLTGGVYYNDSNTAVNTYTDKGFLQTAFTDSAQNIIKTTKVRNDGLSTIDNGGYFYSMADGSAGSDYTDYTCADTDDKIFLLSLYEATNQSYGMPSPDAYYRSDRPVEHAKRCRLLTDYAKANNVEEGVVISSSIGYDICAGYWMLRSPDCAWGTCTTYVHPLGYIGNGHKDVSEPDFGIVPALCVSFQ